MTRFLSAHRGAAAVEFALVSIPFFALTFGIIDVGLIYFMSVVLEDATNYAARQIRTGQFESTGSPSAATFKTLVCSRLTWLGSNCTNNLSVDVQTFTSFSGITDPNPVANGKVQQQSNLSFQTGSAGSIVLVQTYYTWTVLAPGLDEIATPLSGNQMLLTSTAVFRNEPYSSS